MKHRFSGKPLALLVALLLSTSFAGRVQAGKGPTEQSPINIRYTDVTKAHLAKLKFNYPKTIPLQVINTGSPDPDTTVRAIPQYAMGAALAPAGNGTASATVTVNGVVYSLLQFHFHTASEHEINGHKYPLELHMVHQAQDGSLLVVGVFIHEGNKAHPELRKIFSDLPQNTMDNKEVASFKLAKLLPSDHTSFRYDGSLTTPPFTEGVKWVVLDQTIEMSTRQIAAFKELYPTDNSREVQELNGRVINTDVTRRAFYRGKR